MNISIIGAGYVGLVTGACFSELGNRVILADNNRKKIADLKKGIIPIFEPGLEELIAINTKNKRLTFTADIKDAVGGSEIIFIAVGTPASHNGEADLTGIENVARNIARNITGYRLIVEKSTVPVETGSRVKQTVETYIRNKVKFDVASNPEFLREGRAINDFMHPDRIVIGVESKKARDILVDLYKPLNAALVITDIKSAELIKHASNSFLAAKISFINAVSCICDKVGADIIEVAKGMGLDKRIGADFLNAGIGYGGSCFPKDLDAFIKISERIGYDFTLLKAVKEINEQQKKIFLNKVRNALWIVKDKTIAVLGLSFKPDTDDIRSAPAIDLVKSLAQEGAKLRVYDPQSMQKAEADFKELNSFHLRKGQIKFCKDSYDACSGADCLMILTEWDEFKGLDFLKIKKMLKRPLLIDGRNVYEPKVLKEKGFKYINMGRGDVL